MKTQIYILVTALFACLVSCEEDIISNQEPSEEISRSTVDEYSEMEDGRMSFADKTDFEIFYRAARELDEETFASDMERKFYSKEFFSLMPIVTELNAEKQFERHVAKLQEKGIRSESGKGSLISKKDYSGNLETLESIFGEELFASLLNQNGEIAVGKKIYKYTDVGLFIVKKKQIRNLYKYMEKQGISLSFMEPTPKNVQQKYVSDARRASKGDCNEMLRTFEDNSVGLGSVEHFLAAREDCGGSGGGGTGGTGGGGSSSAATPDEIRNALDGVSPCDIKKPWLSNLFWYGKNMS